MDLAVEVPVPDTEARVAILSDTLRELSSVLNSGCAHVQVNGSELSELATELEGISGRRLRKLVFESVLAVADSGEPALTVGHLRVAAARSTSLVKI